MIQHKIAHVYQPTNTTCGYAALAMLLSFYGKNITVESLVNAVEQPLDKNGDPTGSITTELVTWCLQEGFNSKMHSFDIQMLDLSWRTLSQSDLLKKIRHFRSTRNVLGLGVEYGKRYMNGYVKMMENGGTLHIQPHITSVLIDELLQKAPVYANVCSDVMDGLGRTKTVGLRQFEEDDVNGTSHTHSIVIYGKKGAGYLVADPWRGLRTLNIETLLCSISMAQIECDNMVFQLQPA